MLSYPDWSPSNRRFALMSPKINKKAKIKIILFITVSKVEELTHDLQINMVMEFQIESEGFQL